MCILNFFDFSPRPFVPTETYLYRLKGPSLSFPSLSFLSLSLSSSSILTNTPIYTHQLNNLYKHVKGKSTETFALERAVWQKTDLLNFFKNIYIYYVMLMVKLVNMMICYM